MQHEPEEIKYRGFILIPFFVPNRHSLSWGVTIHETGKAPYNTASDNLTKQAAIDYAKGLIDQRLDPEPEQPEPVPVSNAAWFMEVK